MYIESTPVLPEVQMATLRQRCYKASEDMLKEFSKLMDSTSDCLKRVNVTPRKLSLLVLNELANMRIKHPADLKDKLLNTCVEVDEVLYELKQEDIIVFHDTDILECVIRNHVGETEPLTNELKQYKQLLDKYFTMRICEHHLFHQNVVGIPVTSVSQNAKLYLFMDSTWTEKMSLRKLFRLQERITTVLQCGNIQLTAIRLGSLHFCYTVLNKEFAHHELQIQQVIKLINFGVAILQKKISGCEHFGHTEEACT